MTWLAIGDWAADMDQRTRGQRRERLKHAAAHFGIDVLDILGDHELEERLLARYQVTGQPWPTMDDQDEDEQ